MDRTNPRLRILLVEDNDAVRNLGMEMLTEVGHDTVAVSSAEEGLAALAAQTFDAVMTDVRLPGMSGMELAKQVVAAHSGIPVVIASAYGEISRDLLPGALRSNVWVLPKPYDFETLERVLAEATRRSET